MIAGHPVRSAAFGTALGIAVGIALLPYLSRAVCAAVAASEARGLDDEWDRINGTGQRRS